MSFETRKHPAVQVRVGPWSEEIDEQIAPLIRELWLAGIETMMSCQEAFGMIWIEFPMLKDLVKFLDLVAEFSPGRDSLYNRINPYWQSTDPDLDWIYELHPLDAAFPDPEDPSYCSAAARHRSSAFGFTFSLRIPPSDLPQVLERLRRFNNEHNAPRAIDSTADRQSC